MGLATSPEEALWPWPSPPGLGSFALTVPTFSVNTLAQVQQYAATQIPADSIVVTEQNIGDLIQQSGARSSAAAAMPQRSTVRDTWRTYLQSSFTEGDTAFHKLMTGATPIKSFRGAWEPRHLKLRPQSMRRLLALVWRLF